MELINLTPVQLRALEIYTSSADIHNGYTPLSLEKIAQQLRDEGFQASSSAIGRWKTKYQFDSHLQAQIQLIIIDDEEKLIERKALSTSVEKKLVDIKRNNELTADCYELMELFTEQVVTHYDEKQYIMRDDIKIIKDIAVFTGGREDKLLDRLADSGGDKISSEQMKEQFEMIDVEIEDE